MDRPTGPNQTKEYMVSYSKPDIIKMVKESNCLDSDTLEVVTGLALIHAIEFICKKAAAELVPLVGVIADAYTLMEALTSFQQKNLLQDMVDWVWNRSDSSGVIVKYHFKSFQKGSQGYFWNPMGTAEIAGRIYG